MSNAVLVGIVLVFMLFGAVQSDSSPGPRLQAGAQLQVDLMKRGSSELSQTILNEPKIATFSGDVPAPPSSGLLGELVPFSPLDGCKPLQYNSIFHSNSTGGQVEFMSMTNSTSFIVLLKKGQCNYLQMFETVSKVPNVVGLLIYDPSGPSFVTTMNLQSTQKLVSGFLISSKLGEDLLKKVTKYRELTASNLDDNPWVRITMSYTPVEINMAKGLQIFLIVVVITLILSLGLSMIWNFKIRSNRLTEQPETPQPPPRRKPDEIPIDEEFLAKIPKRSYRSTNTSPVDFSPKSETAVFLEREAEEEDYRQRLPHNETCPICLEEFYYGTTINQLHCGHCYHPKCIIPWLQTRSPLCPLCKIDVRVSLIEAEELAFVRSLRKLHRAKSTSVVDGGMLVKKMVHAEGLTGDRKAQEMQEVYVISSSESSLRARNSSFDSIPLEAAPISVEPHSRSRSSGQV